MTKRREVPELKAGDLRDYLPSLSYAIRAVRDRERALTARFERVGADQAEEVREELEELVQLVEATDV